MRSLIGLSFAAFSFAAFSLAAVAAPAPAPTDEQRARCANEDSKLSATEAMAACTLIINLKPKDVLDYALAYSNRAVAEDSLGLNDRANADVREAHRIDPADFHATSVN
jgi:hypothetical protein